MGMWKLRKVLVFRGFYACVMSAWPALQLAAATVCGASCMEHSEGLSTPFGGLLSRLLHSLGRNTVVHHERHLLREWLVGLAQHLVAVLQVAGGRLIVSQK